MATLLVDLGNTRIKWAWLKGQRPGSELDLRSAALPLDSILSDQWIDLPAPDAVWLVAVGSEAIKQRLIRWIKARWNIEPRIMQTAPVTAGVQCGYRDFRQLGADRWAAILAAHRRMPQGVCVVDCGTACTLDVIDGQGRHLGGYILPGIELMKSMLAQTTHIEAVPGGPFELADWGTSTASCIHLGVQRALVTLIEWALERLQMLGVCDPGLILTGGGAETLASQVQIEHHRLEGLVLEGLVLYMRETAV